MTTRQQTIPAPEGQLAECKLCGKSHHWIGDHLAEAHGLTIDAYLSDFPDAPTCSSQLLTSYIETLPETRQAANSAALTVSFADVAFPVDWEVPASACLPMPSHYAVPVHGDLARDVQDATVAVRCNRSLWIWGPPGTGKDALFSALCATTRRPSLLFNIAPGADITAWKFSRALQAQQTVWEEGVLLKAVRDGYQTPSGRQVPYLIVLSDFDRATRPQAEELRLVLDSIQGRILGPEGETYPVLPGTVIVATANSSGAGDTTGRCISANPIDASILDRFERKIRFRTLDQRDEEPIIRAKFPLLATDHPQVIPMMMNASNAIRQAIEKNEVFCEWSHRALCAWAGAAEDLIKTLGTAMSVPNLLRRSSRVVLDGLPDIETRDLVKRIMDPHVLGGAVNEGDTSHINKTDPLS